MQRRELRDRQFYPDGNFPQSYIGAATRALLRERGIRQASVLCRVDIPGVTDRLFTQDIELTF
ncbi:MAG TPA: hypothetical protein VEG34_07025 [Thermoanaerobaculia bacterium]|nr:hypothetical protein [Thermoanaerobaculia bacterium]